MCGIAGVVRWDGTPSEQELRRMSAAIAHRGPDGDGYYAHGRAALIHRRLSIIDLDGGQQPMSNEDGTIWITFNGEIYNFKELRLELDRLGHHFVSRCDTEVIVHGYEQWGEEILPRLRGMFAFAILDQTKHRVFIARDRFGIKPLVYRHTPDSFAFASELQALREIDGPPPRGRIDAIEQFLQLGYIAAPDTIYADTWKLRPGHSITMSIDGGVSEQKRWAEPWRPQAFETGEDLAERCRAVLEDSVRAHLVSDVPFGVFLSGGVDSTLVASMMGRLLGRDTLAFSIGFDEAKYSELPHAREAAKRLGIRLEHEIVRQDADALLPGLIHLYGEPFGDSSSIPTWYVCQLARRHVPMVLSGDGGDEFFAGYGRYGVFRDRSFGRLMLMAARRRGDWPLALRLLTARRWGNGAEGTRAWSAMNEYVPDWARRSLWRREFRPLVRDVPAAFAEVSAHAPTDPVSFGQAMDVGTYLPNDILAKVDIASMAHGLEVRTPLIDASVAEFAAQLPVSMLVGSDGATPKRLLKSLVADVMGVTFSQRPKQGFGIPRDEWLLPGSPLRKRLDHYVRAVDSPLRRFFEPSAMGRMLTIHDRTHLFSTPLWPMLVLGLWMDQNPEVSF